MASYFQQADEYLKARLIERLQATDAKTVLKETRALQPGTFANKLIDDYLQRGVPVVRRPTVVAIPADSFVRRSPAVNRRSASSASALSGRQPFLRTDQPVRRNTDRALRMVAAATSTADAKLVDTKRPVQTAAASSFTTESRSKRSSQLFSPVRLAAVPSSSSALRASSAWFDPPALVLPPSAVRPSSSSASYLSPPSSPTNSVKIDGSPAISTAVQNRSVVEPASKPVDPSSLPPILPTAENVDGDRTAADPSSPPLLLLLPPPPINIDEPQQNQQRPSSVRIDIKSDRELRKRKADIDYTEVRRRPPIDVSDADFDVERPQKKRALSSSSSSSEPEAAIETDHARDLLMEAKIGGFFTSRAVVIANAVSKSRLTLWRSGPFTESNNVGWSAGMTALHLQPSAVNGQRYARSIGDFLRAVYRSRGLADADIAAFDRYSAAKKRWIGVSLS